MKIFIDWSSNDVFLIVVSTSIEIHPSHKNDWKVHVEYKGPQSQELTCYMAFC
jgi:hypothetical protein